MKITIDSLLWFLLIFVGAMILAQFFVGIKLSTTGSQLSSLEQEWIELERENQKFREEIALSTSLSLVASKAGELGLQEPKEVLYVTPGERQAQLPAAWEP